MNTPRPDQNQLTVVVEQTTAVRPISPGLPHDPIKHLFDWKHGKFKGTSKIPVWLQMALLLLVALGMVVVPIALVYGGAINAGYRLFSTEPPSSPSVAVEVLRFVLLIGTGLLAYTLLWIFSLLLPVLVSISLGGVEDNTQTKTRVEHFLALRKYVALVCAGIVTSIMATVLFPLPSSSPHAGGAQTAADSFWWSQVAVYLMKNSHQFFVTRACYAATVVFTLILIEKIIVQRIAVNFHSQTLSDRIANNEFGLKVTRRLKKTLKNNDGSGHVTADRLFRALCPAGQELLRSTDFAGYLSLADADRYIAILDPEGSGDLTEEEFCRAIDEVYREHESLSNAVTDQSKIIGKLDVLLSSITLMCGLIISLAILEVAVSILFSALVSTIGSLTFIFGSTVKSAFESVVFVIFTHPFDVDDKIVIDDTTYTVRELGLWASTFTGPGRRITYMSNSTISKQSIVNLRRSPVMNETITFEVLPDTPTQKLEALEASIVDFLRKNSRDYDSPTTLRNFAVTDRDHMTVEITLSHRNNFQNSELKDLRTRNFMLFLREAIKDVGIELAPPYY